MKNEMSVLVQHTHILVYATVVQCGHVQCLRNEVSIFQFDPTASKHIVENCGIADIICVLAHVWKGPVHPCS